MRVDKLVPHIRFKGFEEEWSRKRIKDIVNIQAGGDLDKNKLEKNGKYPVIGNTQKNNGILGFLNTYKINAPAVTVTGRGEIGHASFQSIPFTPVVRILALSNKNEKLNMRFLSLAIDNINFFIESTGVPQLTAPQLGVFKVRLPRVEEQKKIGGLFSKLDRLLDLQQQKLDQLELLKKALLQKLFPKKDAKIPELRFKGFAQEWKKERLGKITEIVMGQAPSSKNYLSSKIRESYVLIQGNADIKDNEVVPRVWTTQVTRLSNPGDIILTVRAPVGELARNKFQAVIGRGVSAFKGNDFLFYYLQKLNMEGYWQHFAAGSTFESVSSKDIAFTVTKLTSVAEQQKIGNLLSKIDRLIELENKKFSNLKQVKKSLLQNMFVE